MANKDTVANRVGSWFRGATRNVYPGSEIINRPGMTPSRFADACIVRGWAPSKPFITKEHVITVFGSCFAKNLLNYLRRIGYAPGSEESEAQIVRYSSGMVTTHSIRQQFEWAYEDRVFPEDVWFANPDEPETPSLKSKQDTRDLIDKTDVFVITLGLSEVWYSKETGDVFWKAVPAGRFHPDKHGFRVTTCEENKENLRKILKIIRRVRPSSTVIFTLSPVTLVATFRPVSCITADCVSKSILRVALDEVLRDCGEAVWYWPSYEIVKNFYPESYIEDRRHVTGDMVRLIMDLIAKYYLVQDLEEKDDKATS